MGRASITVGSWRCSEGAVDALLPLLLHLRLRTMSRRGVVERLFFSKLIGQRYHNLLDDSVSIRHGAGSRQIRKPASDLAGCQLSKVEVHLFVPQEIRFAQCDVTLVLKIRTAPRQPLPPAVDVLP